MKRILVIGGGGREHVLAWALKNTSPTAIELHCAPGNAGIGEIAQCYPQVKADDLPGLLALANKIGPHLTVIGPEAPLVKGIVDIFSAQELPIVGPRAKASFLEGSKEGAKKFMWRHNIPTANAWIFHDAEAAKKFIKENSERRQLVVKADGLCGGKGVTVTKNDQEAMLAVDELMVQKKFGTAGESIVIEEKLEGWECSLIVLVDGSNGISLLPATDFKRRFDGDEGPNTGGMGCYSPVPTFTLELQKEVMKKTVVPTIKGMADDGMPFHGFLYVGLMITKKGPFVLEYNVRMGDPEAEVILPLLKSDLSELLFASTVPNGLRNMKVEWHNDVAVGVVIVHDDYPNKSSSGKPIMGISSAKAKGALVFHAGTAREPSGIVTAGGRILDVVGRGKTFAEARRIAYAGADDIVFSFMDYRRDIASKV
ncbi:MAG: phosphoribosylamine--glycine ligase [Candidatus Liptonbacteria bacterium]|nr:phosphoribosylamine--glycine ligase [Candidatus Liptonbacteria bacterium]